jgi:hypothetical protein
MFKIKTFSIKLESYFYPQKKIDLGFLREKGIKLTSGGETGEWLLK